MSWFNLVDRSVYVNSFFSYSAQLLSDKPLQSFVFACSWWSSMCLSRWSRINIARAWNVQRRVRTPLGSTIQVRMQEWWILHSVIDEHKHYYLQMSRQLWWNPLWRVDFKDQNQNQARPSFGAIHFLVPHCAGARLFCVFRFLCTKTEHVSYTIQSRIELNHFPFSKTSTGQSVSFRSGTNVEFLEHEYGPSHPPEVSFTWSVNSKNSKFI